MKKARKLLLLAPLLLFATAGCLDQKPKVLGSGKRFDFSAFDGGTQNLFRFNFALRGTTTSGVTTFFLQGAANTKSGMVGTCNFAGSGCECKFLDAAGVTLDTASGSSQITYDDRGNYYKCFYDGASSPTSVATIKIQNIAGTTVSEAITVETDANSVGGGGAVTLTLAKLIGTDLDLNRVRHVYRYECEFNFLQKAGTTTQSFDCSNQATSCDPDNTATKNFCLLKARFPYHLFSDTYSTNFHQKISDKIYNGGGTDRICGLQIKQIDCVGTDGGNFGTPAKQFGLFGEQTGIWDTSVQLGPGPDLIPTSYGFAARTNANNECPPGLEKRIFYRANGADGIVTSDISPSHNFTSGLTSTEVGTTTTTPAAFSITKFSGGTGGFCNGTTCTLPNSFVSTPVKTFSYSSTGQTEFCVIPSTLLL